MGYSGTCTASCTVPAVGRKESLALSLTYALMKGGLLSCLIFNGPKSLHNLNESRAFLEENQGGKRSTSKGRRGEEGVERENEQQ